MKKSFVAAVFYLVVGLLSGVFYREFSKAHSLPEGKYTQLAVVHTHVLTLGFVFFLVVLALVKLFDLASDARFNHFFVVYNLGLVLSSAMMVWHGIFTITSGENDNWPSPLSMVAGLGHATMAIGLALLLLLLGPRVWADSKTTD